MTGAVVLLASGAAAALVFMLRGGALDAVFLGASVAALPALAAAKAPWYARAAALPLPKAFAGALLAGIPSLLMVLAIAISIREPRLAIVAAPVVLIAFGIASTKYGRVLPESPWDLLTPARLALLQVAGAAMAAVWIAFATGIEPSIFPRNFPLFRGAIQFAALLLCSILAGAWDGAMLCTLGAKDRMGPATSAAIRANLAVFAAGVAAIALAATR